MHSTAPFAFDWQPRTRLIFGPDTLERVGEIARDRGVPFLTLRVVADGAARILPLSALEATNPDGSISTARALTTLALHPWELADMVRLGFQTGAARKTLRNLALLGVPRLFFM